MADLKRIRNGKVIEELLKVVWSNYVNMFIHMNNLRMEENEKKDKLLRKSQQEIKRLKEEIAQYEQQNRERKIRKEMKMKMKIRERNIILTTTSSSKKKAGGRKHGASPGDCCPLESLQNLAFIGGRPMGV